MFEHFRAWFKNPRIRNAVVLILTVIVLIAVLKHYNLYEGFSAELKEPRLLETYQEQLKEPKLLETYQQQPKKLEHFSDNSIKITRM